MTVAETSRLQLRRFTGDDAAFVHALVNDPSWLAYIGDKGVRTLDDARRYLENGPMAMYGKMGFGLYAATLRETGTPIGMCGPIKRDTLDDVDLGFAFPAAVSRQRLCARGRERRHRTCARRSRADPHRRHRVAGKRALDQVAGTNRIPVRTSDRRCCGQFRYAAVRTTPLT
jgi:hypothetical protein